MAFEGLEVRGADDFLRLSKHLKVTGQKDLRKELHKGLRESVKPHTKKATDRLASALPSGLSGKGKATKQQVKVKTGRDPGVSVVVRYGKAGRGIGASNARMLNRQGRFRHPVFARGGSRGGWPWAAQSVPGARGWFDDTYRRAAPDIRKELGGVLDDVAQQIVDKSK